MNTISLLRIPVKTIRRAPGRCMLGLAVLALVVSGSLLQAQDPPRPKVGSNPPTSAPSQDGNQADRPGAATAGEQDATRPPAEAEKPAGDAAASDGQAGARGDQAGAGKKTEDEKKTAEPEPRREPTASEILRALTNDATSGKPVIRPARPGEDREAETMPVPHAPNAINKGPVKLLPDGYRLVNRPGRLTREGDHWTFTFESRSQGTPELPIRLLPNRLLEDMEHFSAGGERPVVFIVSGEVTEYHGVNYLLVQKLLTRPNLGNLQ